MPVTDSLDISRLNSTTLRLADIDTLPYEKSQEEDLELELDEEEEDDDDVDEELTGSPTGDEASSTITTSSSKSYKPHGRKKMDLTYIQDKSRRLITLSKRKNGLMKKAFELATLTQSEVLVVVASQNNHVYTFATKKFNPLVESAQGKEMIQSLLEGSHSNDNILSPVSMRQEMPEPQLNSLKTLKRKAGPFHEKRPKSRRTQSLHSVPSSSSYTGSRSESSESLSKDHTKGDPSLSLPRLDTLASVSSLSSIQNIKEEHKRHPTSHRENGVSHSLEEESEKTRLDYAARYPVDYLRSQVSCLFLF